MVSQYPLFHLPSDLIFRADMRQLDSKAQREKTLAGRIIQFCVLWELERFTGKLGMDNSLSECFSRDIWSKAYFYIASQSYPPRNAPFHEELGHLVCYDFYQYLSATCLFST